MPTKLKINPINMILEKLFSVMRNVKIACKAKIVESNPGEIPKSSDKK